MSLSVLFRQHVPFTFHGASGTADGGPRQQRCPFHLSRNTASVAGYRTAAPHLADWLAEQVPEMPAMFEPSPTHRRCVRTDKRLERLHREVRRRSRWVGVFPNEAALERLVTAIFIESDEDRETSPMTHIKRSTLKETKCTAKFCRVNTMPSTYRPKATQSKSGGLPPVEECSPIGPAVC